MVDVVVVEGRWGGRVVVVGGRRGATLILPMGAPALLRGLPSPPLARPPPTTSLHALCLTCSSRAQQLNIARAVRAEKGTLSPETLTHRTSGVTEGSAKLHLQWQQIDIVWGDPQSLETHTFTHCYWQSNCFV